MHHLHLPALRSDDALGFLAALGVLELTTATLPTPARLHWQGPAVPAILTTDQPLTIDTLTDLLTTHLPPPPPRPTKKKTPTPDTNQPPITPWDPFPHAAGLLTGKRDPTGPNDPLRTPVDTTHATLRQLAQQERETDSDLPRWFAALTNPLAFETKTAKADQGNALPDDSAGPTAVRRTPITPLIAAAGQMTLVSLVETAVKECHRDPEQIRSALTGWRRVNGYASANLDHRSLGDAHTNPEGEAYQRGAPGPTWLALHALATFRLTATGRSQAATSWDTTNARPALRWPAWTPPLTATAVTVLLEHPAVRATDPAQRRNATMLTNLGVTALYEATRTQRNSSDGPLAPSTHLWP